MHMYTFSRFDNTVVRYIKYRHWSDTLRTRTPDNEESFLIVSSQKKQMKREGKRETERERERERERGGGETEIIIL